MALPRRWQNFGLSSLLIYGIIYFSMIFIDGAVDDRRTMILNTCQLFSNDTSQVDDGTGNANETEPVSSRLTSDWTSICPSPSTSEDAIHFDQTCRHLIDIAQHLCDSFNVSSIAVSLPFNSTFLNSADSCRNASLAAKSAIVDSLSWVGSQLRTEAISKLLHEVQNFSKADNAFCNDFCDNSSRNAAVCNALSVGVQTIGNYLKNMSASRPTTKHPLMAPNNHNATTNLTMAEKKNSTISTPDVSDDGITVAAKGDHTKASEKILHTPNSLNTTDAKLSNTTATTPVTSSVKMTAITSPTTEQSATLFTSTTSKLTQPTQTKLDSTAPPIVNGTKGGSMVPKVDAADKDEDMTHEYDNPDEDDETKAELEPPNKVVEPGKEDNPYDVGGEDDDLEDQRPEDTGAGDVELIGGLDARPKGHPIGTFSSGFTDDTDSHFSIYFLSVVVMCIAMYILFHNKQKILAIIVEGRQDRRRRPNSNLYRKLDNSLEEVIYERPKNTRTNIIY